MGLEAKVASLRGGLSNLEKEAEAGNDTEKAKMYRPYFDKKREVEELQRFRQVLQLKLASEQIDQKLPKTFPANVLQQATPPNRPSSPNRPAAAIIILFGILLEIAGLLMLRAEPRPQMLAA